eukprot:TRINITY_DN33671_c0_g1_i1.p1 TRINITY_DN33671_c0_g1~~TRINITY_DN33671_c0_g1_i1.p1  ORF type:complete len:588 (-),score=149.35 TRINITY_DN33671_c0_g1_i1:175-1938(-)
MSVDYSKWRDLVAQECGQDEKEWSMMTAEERQEVSKRADQEEAKLQANRQAHDEYLRRIQEDVQHADDSWMYDVDLNSYEDFTIKRTWRVVKARGTEFFKLGRLEMAEQQWLGGLLLVQKVGMSWPTASELYTQLKCNLAQLYIKQERWLEAKRVASAALEMEPCCEKALYRRASVHMALADWEEARRDLETLLASYPQNADAGRKLNEVKQVLRAKSEKLKGVGVKLSNAMEDMTSDGTLRKLCVLSPGEAEPADQRWTWPWGTEEWLGPSREKAVLTVHVVVRSVGGEELFSTRERVHLPETPEERDMLRMKMQEVAELDDRAGKKQRSPMDFYAREELRPLRWRFGDPMVYAGFDLAARGMKLGEKAIFEIDQPLLEPSVSDFYKQDGGIARLAGLPNFKHHVEDRKLNLLSQELPEWELDLEEKVQRTVRAELHLVDIELFRDMSPERTGEYLLHISCAGNTRRIMLRQGLKVVGNFTVAGALSGQALYSVDNAVWVLGQEGQESFVDRPGQRSVWIPRCLGQVMMDASWVALYEGAKLEARMQAGPAPMELNPKMARDLHWKRAWSHRPPVAIGVEIHAVIG